ncbi:MAG: ATP-binding cassette domain-containing protein [Acidobacteriota bacterium]|nr:ATP-binding cassette domain-containing protein [Acidobacteriota bacterium]
MSDLERLRRWLTLAAPRRGELARALVMATVASLAGTALFVGAVALLVVSAQRPGLRAIAVFLIAIELVAFLRSPLRFGERMSTHRLGFAAVAHWRQWLMGTVGAWSYSRWQAHATGDLLERSLADTEELQDLWLRAVIPSVATLVTMVLGDVTVALLAPLGRWWAVALASAVLQGALATTLLGRLGALARADRSLRRRRGAYVAALVSSRAAAPEIEQLGATNFLRGRDERLIAELRAAEAELRRVRRRDEWVAPLGAVLAIGVVALWRPQSAGVWLVVASLVALATFDALLTLRGAVAVAVAVTGGAERLDELAPAPAEGRHDASWPTEHTLRFEDVVIRPHQRDARRVSGRVAPGRRLGVTGPSGSGKSTLLRALARLDDVSAGTITIGSSPLDELAEAELRAHVVLVPSEPGLFRGYVRDVVGLGVAANDEDLAALWDLGLHVELNDQWEDLSRGERQRVALIRALVRRPDIVLLDEPTSALGDEETRAVLELLSDRRASVVVATHDPRVLQWCDEVIDVAVTDDA